MFLVTQLDLGSAYQVDLGPAYPDCASEQTMGDRCEVDFLHPETIHHLFRFFDKNPEVAARLRNYCSASSPPLSPQSSWEFDIFFANWAATDDEHFCFMTLTAEQASVIEAALRVSEVPLTAQSYAPVSASVGVSSATIEPACEQPRARPQRQGSSVAEVGSRGGGSSGSRGVPNTAGARPDLREQDGNDHAAAESNEREGETKASMRPLPELDVRKLCFAHQIPQNIKDAHGVWRKQTVQYLREELARIGCK